MSLKESEMIEKIENLRNRIDNLRREIWKRDQASITAEHLETELAALLREYVKFIREHEEIAC